MSLVGIIRSLCGSAGVVACLQAVGLGGAVVYSVVKVEDSWCYIGWELPETEHGEEAVGNLVVEKEGRDLVRTDIREGCNNVARQGQLTVNVYGNSVLCLQQV